MEVPQYQSRGVGPESSGLAPANPAIVGGGAITQGLSAAASGMLVLAAQEQQMRQIEEVDIASRIVGEYLLELDEKSQELIEQQRGPNHENPRDVARSFREYAVNREKALLNSPALKNAPFAHKYVARHMPQAAESRIVNFTQLQNTAWANEQIFRNANTLQTFTQAAINDPSSRPKIDAEFDANLTANVAAGVYDGTRAAALRSEYRNAVNFGIANRLIHKSPHAFLSAQAAGQNPSGAITGDAAWDAVHWNLLTQEQWTVLTAAARTVREDLHREGDERKKLLNNETVKSALDLMWGTTSQDTGLREPGTDAAEYIQKHRDDLTPESYQQLLTENKQLGDKRVLYYDESFKKASAYVAERLTDLAHRLSFDPSLKRTINPDIVRAHVFGKDADLTPQDAEKVLAVLHSSMASLANEDSAQRRAMRDAFSSLKPIIPNGAMPADAYYLTGIGNNSQALFMAQANQHPDMTVEEIYEARDKILVAQEASIAYGQRRTVEQKDAMLLSMEHGFRVYDPGIVTGSEHKLDPAARARIERQFPLMRGLFNLYDKRADLWRSAVEVAGQGSGGNLGGGKPGGK